MQEILKIYSKYLSKSGNSAKDNPLFYNYVVVPFSAGLAGFATFLFILIMMDAAAYVLGITGYFNLGINEVLIAGVGFFLQFTYQFIKSARRI